MNDGPLRPQWLDPWLEKLLRPMQRLPVVTVERTAQQQHRRLQTAAAILLAVLVVLLGAALLAFDAGRAPAVATFLEVAVLLPLIVTALFYGALYVTLVRGKRDDGDHPWRYVANEAGLRIERRNGAQVHDGKWRDWRFAGYRHITVKRQRSITGLDLTLDGQTLTVDLNRVLGGLALARAVVQRLAARDDE